MSMTFKEIQDLIKLMDKSNLSEFSFKTETYEIKIKGPRSYAPAVMTTALPVASYPSTDAVSCCAKFGPAAEASKAESSPKAGTASNLIEIKVQWLVPSGSSAPDKPAFVSVGDSVQKGSVVCIIEAMKLFNEIESEFALVRL